MAAVPTISGSKIREARLRAGMTQSQLARVVNTSERNIVRWETEANSPRMEHVAAIARATGRDVADLLNVGAASDDDEEPHRAMSLDDFLRQHVRQLLHDEMKAAQL